MHWNATILSTRQNTPVGIVCRTNRFSLNYSLKSKMVKSSLRNQGIQLNGRTKRTTCFACLGSRTISYIGLRAGKLLDAVFCWEISFNCSIFVVIELNPRNSKRFCWTRLANRCQTFQCHVHRHEFIGALTYPMIRHKPYTYGWMHL